MRNAIAARVGLIRSFAALAAVCCGVGHAAAEVCRMDLGGSWQVVKEGEDQAIAATVPGCIHTDIMAAKKMPDPFYRDNEKLVQWVGQCNWVYRREFDVLPEFLARGFVLLRCEGLDTLATIRINGVQVARTDNMFRTYEFDVKKLLKAGSNLIEIRFDSVLPLMREKEKARPIPTWMYPGAGYVRKEPCNFGWDWGPTLITCGIWRNIGLVAFDQARLDDVIVLQDHSRKGEVGLDVEAATAPAAQSPLTARISVWFGGQQLDSTDALVKDGRAKAAFRLAGPKLWWPAGMGQQPLYTVKVELLNGDGKLLDSTARRIGLRSLRTIQQTAGSLLHLEVNGVPFFAKGANWIPADCFPNRLTKDVLRRYVEDAAAANMNVLRFWGGGYYEDDALFDACDELGVCVWLDCKFSCTTYPAFDDAFLDNVKHEVRDNLKRLRHHAAIAVWCGNNEIMYFRNKDNKWTKSLMGKDDYDKLFRDAIGGEGRRLAPQSDYVTGSPDCGDVHYWDVWHGGKPFEVYRNMHGFMSEFGFQSFPEPKSVLTFTQPADRDSVYSPVMKHHERSNRMYCEVAEDGTLGTNKIMQIVKKYFRDPKDFESTLWLSQITQGYGIKYGAEGWRREMPKSTGCVYWQFNDIWPGSSWSSIDYFGRWKALQYMAKRFYAPVLVSGAEDAKKGTIDVYVTSDRLDDCRGKLTWIVSDVSGKTLDEGVLDVDVPARKSRMVRSLSLREQLERSGANNVLAWLKLDVDGRTVSDNMVSFVYPRELKLVDPRLSAEVSESPGGSGTPREFTVTLRAEHPALWAWLELAGVDARCSQNFVHVSQFAPAEITVRPSKPLSEKAFRESLRVKSLYDTYAH
jgi:beta-mannosidase